jgi:kinesin family member 15
MKSNEVPEGNNGWNARRSLHLLKMSLSRSPTFQAINEDSDEEMEIDESDIEKPYVQDNVTISSIGGKESEGLQSPMEICAGTSQAEALDGDKNLIPTKRSCSGASKFSAGTDGDGRCNVNLAASIQRGLQVIQSHQNNSAWKRASIALNARIMDVQPCKVDAAVQTDPEESEARDPLALIPSCLLVTSANESRDPNTCRDLQIVPADGTVSSAGAVPAGEQKQQHFLKVSTRKKFVFANLYINLMILSSDACCFPCIGCRKGPCWSYQKRDGT